VYERHRFRKQVGNQVIPPELCERPDVTTRYGCLYLTGPQQTCQNLGLTNPFLT
jgi:hypothetical protein